MKKGGFPGGMGGGMNMNMIKQAQKMQQDMMKMQEELKTATYSASSGGGVVTATVSGEKKLLNLEIKPEVISPDDAEMLCDLIVAAVNEATRQAEETTAAQMSKITGGLNLGGLF